MEITAGRSAMSRFPSEIVNHCLVIPCYGHTGTVAAVAQAAVAHAPVFVIDDGSEEPVQPIPGCTVIRLGTNVGKGAALRAGFEFVAGQGFTHAITMDADGQHCADDLPRLLDASRAQPDALIVGLRDLAFGPTGRRRSNAVAAFWLRVETKRRLADTQCGLRCYPLELTQRLRVWSGHYAFEYEFLVRALWSGVHVEAIPVETIYRPEHMTNSHFGLADLGQLVVLNIGLVAQAWFVPPTLRAAWSVGENTGPREVVLRLFSEHADTPFRLSLAVGLGLFVGTAPIWGFQMIAVAAIAHRWRLNKPIALLASNISIPPIAPLIAIAAVALGNWIVGGLRFNGETALATQLSAGLLSRWILGSLVLGAGLAIVGTVATYVTVRLLDSRER